MMVPYANKDAVKAAVLRGFSTSAVTLAMCCVAIVPARAECVKLPLSVTQPIVERFIFNQQTLLRDYPKGGDGLINLAGVLVMVSRATPPQILKVSKGGSAEQRTAIGAGFGIATIRCKRAEPQLSVSLERMVRENGDAVLLRGFTDMLRSNGMLTSERNTIEHAKTYREQITKGAEANAYRRNFNVAKPGATAPIRPLAPLRPIGPIGPVPAMR